MSLLIHEINDLCWQVSCGKLLNPTPVFCQWYIYIWKYLSLYTYQLTKEQKNLFLCELFKRSKIHEYGLTIALEPFQASQYLMTYDHLSSYLDEPFNIVICFLSNYTSCVNCRKRTKKTRDMWWQGLPTNVRGKVWKLAIGNDLNLTPGLYPHFYTHTFTTTCTCMPRLTYLWFLPSFY